MISLNEGHNLTQVLDNLKGWANEVFLIDSYSQDNTVDIALHYGVHVVQRKFNGFGDQWNFALSSMPISSPWTMKMDPDEILTDELKKNIQESINASKADAFCFDRRLWFMGRQLPIKQNILRIWKTGSAIFTNVSVNEHPLVEGKIETIKGEMQHHDSPDLEHWIDKQNRYTSAEAILSCTKSPLADKPILFGTSFQRRMWLKANFNLIPGRYFLLFIFYYLFKCAFIAGKVGFIWSKLRSDVMRYIEYKKIEIEITGKIPSKRYYGPGLPDLRVLQND
jgi:glycosyltransferase involved in cell wall biosynthesis